MSNIVVPSNAKPAGERSYGRPQLAFSILLIAVGVVLFLANLGVLPISDIWRYWPSLFILAGVWGLFYARRPHTVISAVIFICYGAVFLCITLGWLHVRTHDGTWPLSMIFLAFGAGALAKTFDTKSSKGLPPDGTETNILGLPFNTGPSENYIRNSAVLGSVTLRVDSQDFQGGELHSILGSIDINMRSAQITAAPRVAVLTVTAIFAGIQLKVPPQWRVQVAGAGILGSFEDKTIPPNTGLDAPTLVVKGLALFAGVEIVD